MKRSIRRAATLLAALTLTTGGFAATATTASATTRALADCPSSYACLWVNANYAGRRWQGQNANPTMPAYISNDASSAYNHGVNCEVHWYDDSNYNGGQLNLGRGRSISNLADLAGWNDTIESMNWC